MKWSNLGLMLLVLVLATGCGLLADAAASGLTNVEEVEINAGGSCGIRSPTIVYEGAKWNFDLPFDGSKDHPHWAGPEVVVRVGGLDGEVWAVAPDGSRWRLVRQEESSLYYCLW